MANPFEFQRLKSIFDPSIMGAGPTPNVGMGPTPDFTQPPITIPQNVQPDFDPSSMMGDLYKPQTEASNRFEQLVGQYPQYEKPNWWRAAAGALSAFGPGGHDIGMKVANWNNERRMSDWKNQIGPAQAAANLERQENVNNRTLAHQTIQNEINFRRNEATRQNQETQNRIRQQRADIYDFKTRNPNLKFDFTGPKVKVLNPATGEVSVTQWDTGNMSEADKLDLQQANALERIDRTGSQARETEKTRQTGRESLAETRGWKVYNVPDPDNPGQFKGVKINEITGEVADLKPSVGGAVGSVTGASGGNKPELPTQTKVRLYNNASRIADERPDLAPFIKFGPGANEFSILPPSGGEWYSKTGPNQAQLDEINSLIYGQQGGGIQSSTPTIPQTTVPTTKVSGGGRGGGSGRPNPMTQGKKQPPQAPPGWTYVLKPDGSGWTAVRSATGAK